MSRTIKAAYFTDPHCPLQDDAAVEWAHKVVSEFKPDYLICGGDLFEASAASRFDNEDKHDLRDEYRAGALLLDSLAGAVPDANLVWIRGNHDRNLQNPGRIERPLRSQLHWNVSEWRDSFLRWKQIPYDFSAAGCFQLGQVMFWHGFDGPQDVNAIRINNITGGHAHRLVVGGHTHTPHGPQQVMRTKKVRLPLWYANGGTLGPRSPEWTHRQDTSEWKPAVVLVELASTRRCLATKNWECRTEVME